MKFSCCIEMLFTEYDFVERIYKARDAGFDCVEFWCWEDKDITAIKNALNDTGMQVGIFQANIGGRMIDKNDNKEYLEGIKRSLETARELKAKTLFLMSDIMKEDRSVLEAPYKISLEEKYENTVFVLRSLIPYAEKHGVTFVIEPLNTKVDHMGYSLCHTETGARIIRDVGHPNIRLLYDAYHMQIMEGNIIDTIKLYADTFGYFHIADVPGRFEPGTGELNYKNIIDALKSTGYTGNVGFEFNPKNGDSMKTVRNVLQHLKQ